ncbi:ATP-binding protein [Akkermansiaceae bacterium]|nr:ATP-binding protein [Akkermansiaceae bacterium]
MSLSHLLKYFPTGYDRGEKQILNEVFVAPHQLASILGAPSGNPRILVGRKGVGKTALLEHLSSVYEEAGVPVLFIRPEDIDTDQIGDKTDIASLKKCIYDSIISSIASKIGVGLKGMLSGDKAALYNEAVSSGKRDASFIANILYVIQTIGKPIADLDGPSLVKKLSPSKNSSALSSAMDSYFKSNKTTAYLFIDDTDQIASPEDPSHKNRIWALILALRKISQDCPELKCIATLRTEVWLRLTKNEKGQRDQIDHIRPLIIPMRAPESHMIEIVHRRIHRAAQEIDPYISEQDAFGLFFENSDVKLPTSNNERRSWEAFLIKNSRERPRDTVQLIERLIGSASQRNSSKIGDIDVDRVMSAYSKDKTEDLAVEMGEICSNFLEVVRSFAGKDFDWKFEELHSFLSKLPSKFGLYVFGSPLKPEKAEDALILLSILHESEFINCRVKDKSKPLGYNHINFLDDPHFVQKDRWNELQNTLWEIHPVFRSFLLSC